MLDRIFPTNVPPPRLVTVFFGANDAAVNQKQHVPLREFTANIHQIVRHVQKLGTEVNGKDTPVLLITPPPVDEAAWARHLRKDSSDRTNADMGRYATATVEAAQELK